MPDQIAYGDNTTNLEEIRTRHTSGLLFYISFLVFLLMLAAYGGLVYLNRAQTTAEKEIIAQINQKQEELRPELVQHIFSLEEHFQTIQSLIQKHSFPSRVFAWLEQRTHPRVSFSSLNFDSTTRQLTLPGTTDSLTSLNQQIAIFQQDPNIQEVQFGGLSFNKESRQGGSIRFNAIVVLKPSFLQLAP